MTASPLDRPATESRLRRLHRLGLLGAADLRAAMDRLSAPPGSAEWRAFLDRALLGAGAALTGAGVLYFFARNWASLGRFSRVGLLLGILVLAATWAWRAGPGSLPGQMASTAGAAMGGLLLAVIGQSYQQGADPWQLFAWSALLGLPWLVASRFGPLLLAEVALVDLTIVLWWDQTFPRPEMAQAMQLLLGLAAIAGVVWAGVEAARGDDGRWLPRVLALMTLAPVIVGAAAWLAIEVVRPSPVTGDPGFGLWGPLAFALAAGVMVLMTWRFRSRRPDLFMLALVALGVIVLVSTALAKLIFFDARSDFQEDWALPFLLMAAALMAQAGAAAVLLRRAQLQMGDD